MAHIQKFKRGSLGHMLQHYDRTSHPEHVKPEKTKLNYNLATTLQPLEQMEFLNKRLSQVKVQKRADVNLMCDCVVTAPKDLDQDNYKSFFKSAFVSLANRYGKNNVISAYVHMDEVTPHMHFAFIPVTKDLKKGVYKVSAKEVVNRQDLKTLHNDLQADISRSLGFKVKMLNGATQGGNKTINELKRTNSQEDFLNKLKGANIASVKDENIRLKKQIAELEAKIEDLEFFKDDESKSPFWGLDR